MKNLRFEFYGFFKKPYICIDGLPIKMSRKWRMEGVFLRTTKGTHTITVCERRMLYKWYWWILLFNILYPFMCLKGYSGKQGGYDGECVTAAFTVACTDHSVTCIKITRKKHSWNETPLEVDYNSMLLQSTVPLCLKDSVLPPKQAFRLKFCMMAPFVLISIMYIGSVFACLRQQNMNFSDILISCGIGILMIIYTVYKICKIKAQKSFSVCYKISRIGISAPKK